MKNRRGRLLALVLAAVMVSTIALPQAVQTAAAGDDTVAAEETVPQDAEEGDAGDSVSVSTAASGDDTDGDTDTSASGDDTGDGEVTDDDTTDGDTTDDDTADGDTTDGGATDDDTADGDTTNGGATDDSATDDSDENGGNGAVSDDDAVEETVAFAFADGNTCIESEQDAVGETVYSLTLQEPEETSGDSTFERTTESTISFTVPSGYTLSASSANTSVLKAAVDTNDSSKVILQAVGSGKTKVTFTASCTSENDGGTADTDTQTLSLTVYVQEVIDVDDIVWNDYTRNYDGTSDVTLSADFSNLTSYENSTVTDISLSNISAAAESKYVQKYGDATIPKGTVLTPAGMISGETVEDLSECYLFVDGSEEFLDSDGKTTKNLTVSDVVTVNACDFALNMVLINYDASGVYTTYDENNDPSVIYIKSTDALKDSVSIRDDYSSQYDAVTVSADDSGAYQIVLSASGDDSGATVTNWTSPFTIQTDADAPEITITHGEDTSLYLMDYPYVDGNGDLQVSAKLYLNKYSTNEVISYSVTDEDSGVKAVSYCWVEVNTAASAQELSDAIAKLAESDWTTGSTSGENVNIDVTKDANKVFVVKTEDNVGNTRYAASNGIVIDLTDPKVELSITDGQMNNGIYGKDGADIAYTAKIYDPVSNSSVPSGISKIKVTVTSNGSEVTGSYSNGAAADSCVIEDLDDLTSETKTEDGVSYDVYTLSGIASVGIEATQTIGITVTAYDAAGNVIDTTESSTASASSGSLLADGKAPSVTAAYNDETSNEKQYTGYYTSRELNLKVTERDFDANDILLSLTAFDGKETTSYKGVSLTALSSTVPGISGYEMVSDTEQGTDSYTDDRVVTYTITFSGDDLDYDYTVTGISMTDQAGNPSGTCTALADDTFTVDTTAPVVSIAYYDASKNEIKDIGTDKSSSYYSGGAVTAVVSVEERNFCVSSDAAAKSFHTWSQGQQVSPTITWSEGDAGSLISASQEASAWTYDEDAGVWKYTYTFETDESHSTDGDYTFAFSYTDLAGNTVSYDSGSTHYFTLDTTDPEIASVTYTVGKNTVTPGISESGRYYADGSVTVVIEISERNFYRDDKTFDPADQVDAVITYSEDSAYAQELIEAAQDPDSWSYDETSGVWTCTLSFAKDGDYTLALRYTDLAGNTAASYAARYFTVDTIAPVISVAYYDTSNTKISVGTDYNDRIYEDGAVTAVVSIEEQNFTDGIDLVITENGEDAQQADPDITFMDYDGNDASVTSYVSTLQSLSSWEYDEADGVWECEVTFSSEGDYTFALDYKDLAGNAAASYAKHYFTVDKTDPVLSVVYTSGGAKVTPGTSESDRLYEDDTVYVTLTVTERNFKRSDGTFDTDQLVLSNYIAVNEEGEAVSTSDFEALLQDPDNWTSTGTYTWETTLTFKKDANYTLRSKYTDLAARTDSSQKAFFTVDTTDPEGTITIDDKSWDTFYKNVYFGLFTNTYETVTITADDITAGVKKIEYFKYKADIDSSGTFEGMTYSELEAYTGWKKVSSTEECTFKIESNEQAVVYAKITDKSGNVTYLNSKEGVVADDTKPQISIEITIDEPEQDIYDGNVPFTITVTDPNKGKTYSGLADVYYEIIKDGETVTQTKDYSSELGSAKDRTKTFTKSAKVNASKNNSNDVAIVVYAVDNAGNTVKKKEKISIDITKPTITVEYNLNEGDASNETYYNKTRTATVTITERNFDASATEFTITNTDGTIPGHSSWTHSSDSGESDEATHVCTVEFEADGDYTFTVATADKAGNKANYSRVDEFTIDQTLPEISVSYDNNDDAVEGYYNADRTATITVTEHNFNASDVAASVTAALEGAGVSTPDLSGFSGSGDVHTATVTFSDDADYTFTLAYTDLAGNEAEYDQVDSFTIDQTAPELNFYDVENESANKGTVAPRVEYTDNNFTASGVTIELSGYNHAKEYVTETISSITNGQSCQMADFTHDEDTDDLYTLTATITDKAGNETTDSITFSVNRFGSNFVLSEATEEYVNAYYQKDSADLVIIEYNVDTIEESELWYTFDSKDTELVKDEDYTVKQSGDESSWKTYTYTISAENFVQEGKYSVTVQSTDRAENTSNNKKKKVKANFILDQSEPALSSSVESDARETADSLDMILTSTDMITAVESITVAVSSEDSAVTGTTEYTRDEIEAAGGVITHLISSSDDRQDITVTATDLAGNTQTLEITGVLVTTNKWIQFRNNTPLFIGTIVVIIAVIVFLLWFFLFFRKRRKDDEEGTEAA